MNEKQDRASRLQFDDGSLYLDLMKRCLTNWIYGDAEAKLFAGQGRAGSRALALAGLSRAELNRFHEIQADIESMKLDSFNQEARAEGRDWPPTAHTMIGLKRLDNLQFCIEDVLANDVAGDLIETGVWRGGATIFMRAVLKAHGVSDRRVWVVDSFAGMPPPDPRRYPTDFGSVLHLFDELAVSLEEVKSNFDKYGLLDEQVRFLKGWFRDTLPEAPIEKLAVARLDGDLYESTMEALIHLYPKLSIGGYLIVDDYGEIPPCSRAVHDYRAAHGITEEIISIDSMGIYWQRQR